ncbi:MAG TPA: hypothetical protein VGP33_15020 [Chloroflexota bacterium]|nr:hypothetical protein [Chloroflexota bacterium]
MGVGTGLDAATATLALLDAVVAAVAGVTLVAMLEGAADTAVVDTWADVTALPTVLANTVLDARGADELPDGADVALVPPHAASRPTPTAARPVNRASICRRPIADAE